MKRLLIASTALLGVLVAQNAWADPPQTATVAVTAGVGMDCSMTKTDLQFHTINLSANTDANATITVNCTNGAGYELQADYGMNASGNQRNLKGINTGTNLMPYNVYQDSSHLIPWGNILGVDTVQKTANGSNQITTVYGRIPNPGGTVVSDVYQDTLTITLVF